MGCGQSWLTEQGEVVQYKEDLKKVEDIKKNINNLKDDRLVIIRDDINKKLLLINNNQNMTRRGWAQIDDIQKLIDELFVT